MFPRSKVVAPAEVAKAIARGPIQLTHFPPLRPRRRFPLASALLLAAWTLALLFLSFTAGGPACDRWSALPWLECPHVR